MRLVLQIPHSELNIQVFIWNEKYLIEIENGPFKQTYKIPVERIKSEHSIQEMLNDQEFLTQCINQFEVMFINFKQLISKHL